MICDIGVGTRTVGCYWYVRKSFSSRRDGQEIGGKTVNGFFTSCLCVCCHFFFLVANCKRLSFFLLGASNFLFRQPRKLKNCGNKQSKIKFHTKIFKLKTMIFLKKSCVLLLAFSSPYATAEDAQVDYSGYHNREILLGLFQATGGFDWTDSTNWFQQRTDLCDWKGVTCYTDTESDGRRNGQIRQINLKNNNLQGTVPAVIFEIPFLESFNVEDNANLNIDFTGLNKAQFLIDLSISKTDVDDISNIGAASNLKTLHMTNLGLKGSLPNSLFDMTDLVALYANYNSFSGTIPSSIGGLSSLDELYLYDSDLTGQIPTQIGSLTGLEILTLSQNAFSGSLPTELNNLTNLQLLAIQREYGQEKGAGISGLIPSFDQHRKLTALYLENQNLSGFLDPDFLLECPVSEKVEVNLRNNNLGGAVQSSLQNKQFLSLLLADNNIETVPTDIYDPSTNSCPGIDDWMDGGVADIGCEAFLCPPGTWAPEGRSTTSDICQSCSDATTIDVWGTTKCSGSTTPDNANGLRLVLEDFYKELGGENWKIDQGWLQDDTSVCEWYGITCNQNGAVESINLRNNGLNGRFTTSDIFSIQELKILNLSANSIEFDLTDIGNAKKLEVLDLSSTDLKASALDALIELTDLPTLTNLSLDSNDLGGAVPAPIFSITSLVVLKISHNRFTGQLRTEIGQLANLQRLECSGNSLSGQIPTHVGNLRNLQELLAGENEFGGSLPTQLDLLTGLRTLELQQVIASGGIDGPLVSFRNLRQLTSLKLDSNQLTGSLPLDFLANSGVLESRIEVGLSFNQLEGSLPTSWSRFNNLFVNLAGNKITEIPGELCNLNGWMDGDVANYQCDAILCPKGKYNSIGRRSNDQSTCEDCDSEGSYFGTTSCGGGYGSGGFGSGNFDAADADDITILTEFYVSTGGLAWTRRDGWGDTADYCNWYGIECDAGKRVASIDLTDNNLKGTVPSSIFELEHIRMLLLSKNEVDFSFNGIEEAEMLDTLDLGETNMKSIDGVGNASKLVTLRLNGNDIEGAFPVALYQLTSLQELNLGYNHISGRVPNAIASLTALTTLRLYHNQFTGRIPAGLGDLTRLQELNMAENNFEGTIPLALNDLTDLKFLSLQREGGITGSDVGIAQAASSVTGPGLSGSLPALEGLKSISELYLGVNSLSGSLPYNFLDGVDVKTAPLKVDLTSNLITGSLPGSLSQFDKMDIYMADNRITGIADALCAKSDWLSGAVGKFDCEGILCPANKYNAGVGRKRDVSNPCQDCATGTDGFLGSIECLTEQEKKEGKERTLLEQLYRAASGDFWLNYEGWMDGDVSICDWYGIECESDENPTVISIDLESNNLRGSVPTEIYRLPNLQTLNLQGNVVDFKFDGIGFASALESLDLEEMGLTSVTGIKGATSLNSLRIARNSISTFPTEIFDLVNLEVLELSDNPFQEQPMPTNFQNFPNLVYLGCSACGFTGAVPQFLGFMDNLQHISLGQNGFSGGIPDFSQSINLYHLDLSDQKANGFGLNGPLPNFSQQGQLSELFLQNNDLSSQIPSTLLQNRASDADELVTIDLRSNSLTGAVPTELSRFAKLNLYLAGNQINELPPSLCNNNNWNDGNVATHQCDAILCPVGKFNSHGRAIGALTCSDCDTSDYFGGTFCGSSVEKPILIEFYRSTGGTSWTVDDNWLRNDDYCIWAGITCHDSGEFKGLVKEINLPDNNMIGSVTPVIWALLEGLELFNVEKNDVTVTFDFVSSAQNLETIVISETNTNTLSGIGGVAGSLKSLHVTNANLFGAIPEELYTLTQLENVYLSHNDLSGTLSTSIGGLRRLQHLYMFDNRLVGFLPTELGFLAKLKAISLGENEFIGNIPRQITALPLLEILSLQMEQDAKCESMFCSPASSGGLTGTVPSLDGLPRIKEVYLGHNKFTGTVPAQFLQGVSDKSKQILVDLSYNLIEGRIPKELENFDDLQILLASNLVDGIPDEICNKRDWFNGQVATGCDAILCPKGTFNEFGRRIDSETPCDPCTYPGSTLNFGSTECGPVLIEQFSDRDMLLELYDAAGGNNWKNKDGWNRDDVNECDWFGVNCEPTGQFGTMVVTEVNLAANNLDGIIPSILYHMEDLRKLDVRYNAVEMHFYAIFRSDALEELLLDGTLVPTLNGIGRAKALKTLHLNEAPLGWQPIPEELFTVQTLEDLDLSDSMIGGTLSMNIGNMTNLKHLSLAGNALNGEIPSQIGLLESLEELALSGNNWVGKLPDTLGSLKSLRAFYLDNANGGRAGLTGPLPSFSSMPTLTELHLTDNQFTGTISETFLAAANSASTINVHLNKNALVGTIPSSLSALSKLNIYVADNLITGIGEGLCDMSDWLSGTVGTYRCDAILCPPGEFSPSGREESQSISCVPCPGEEDSKVYGSSFCLAAEKEAERNILQQLFDATGGTSWHNRDRWNDSGFDYCSWYGITCTLDSLVESIILGSNHLVGTLPTEVFQFVKLKNLWLYSNVIDVNFQGIEQATNLESLVLDSTKLGSLEGIGSALSLKELDIRFNNLGGRLPTELDRLTNLERFLCSDNAFTGPVPEFTALRNLKTLRMGDNKMVGTLPSFSRNPVLESLELSHNNMAGTIPTTLLNAADPSLTIFLDLSENSLTGQIPSELVRFSDMTLLLRNNQIEEIPPELCALEHWNGGDVGNFGCDGILCPPGSVSAYGRASRKLDIECTSCPTSHFGQTTCGASASIFSKQTIVLLSASTLALASLWM
jgi:Leucine-rich repeat (LRR) protein